MLRAFHHYFSARKLSFFLAESCAIALACATGALLLSAAFSPAGQGVPKAPALVPLLLLAMSFAAVLQYALYNLDLYDLRVAGEDRRAGARILKAGGSALGVAALLALATSVVVPAGAILGGALGGVLGAVLVRAAMPMVVGARSRVLIVGNGVKALQVSKAIEAEGEDSFEICAMIEPQREGAAGSPGESIAAAASRLRAEYVVMAVDEPRGATWVDSLFQCRVDGRRVYDAAGFSERVLRRLPVAHLRLSDLAFSDDLSVSPGRLLGKRVLDVIVATLMLTVGWLPMLLIALAVKLDSKGPVFYRQERVGLGAKPFMLWKFRSMRTDAEKNGAVWARTNDDRVTRVGRIIRKTRLDELPQLFNVLAGDMSLVGPRPERGVFVEELKKQIPFYGLRDAVPPGLTGWAQIRYPYGASVEDARNKLEFDLYYIKNGSLFLDVAVMFHTARHVLMRKGSR